MKKSKFSEDQIVRILKEVDSSAPDEFYFEASPSHFGDRSWASSQTARVRGSSKP